MARNESDREDLIREATALRQRVEWIVPGERGLVVVGFRRDGSLSVFFDQDPVYQFNPTGQLRRAYVDGFLFRTQGHTLARLTRERTAANTTLLRHDLTADELEQFQTAMRDRLARLFERLNASAVRVEREVREQDIADYADGLEDVLSVENWLAPALPGRKT